VSFFRPAEEADIDGLVHGGLDGMDTVHVARLVVDHIGAFSEAEEYDRNLK